MTDRNERRAGSADKTATAKVDVTVPERPEADRLARIQELQKKVLSIPTSAGPELE